MKSDLKGFERYRPEENLGFQEDRNQRQQPAGIVFTQTFIFVDFIAHKVIDKIVNLMKGLELLNS